MKPRKLDHARLSRNMGSTIRGRASAKAGFFGALQLAESVRRRFRAPKGGGRARDRAWTLKRLIPVRPETLARLEKLAAEVSELVDHRVEPLQVAAVLIERDLETSLDTEETTTNIRSYKHVKDLLGVVGGGDARRSSRGTRAIAERLKKRAGRPT